MDLVLDVIEWEGGLKGHIDYNTDLFQPETVSRMAGHLQVSHAADLGSVKERRCEKHHVLQCFFSFSSSFIVASLRLYIACGCAGALDQRGRSTECAH